MCCHVKEMISSFFIFIYTQTMLFKQGDVAAKVGKTELYVSGGLLDEGHHIFWVNLLKTIRQYRVVLSIDVDYLEMLVEG